MNTTMEDTNCGRVIAQLDLYLDRELTAGASSAIAGHLDQCAACRRELAIRSGFRDRLRAAVRGETATSELRDRISGAIRATPAPMPALFRTWPKIAVGIAAALVVGLGATIAYQLGHLRVSTASQESYIATISHRVGNIMQIGLGDHVHCAVFRKYPTQPPPPEQIAADMGPDYADLVRIVREHLPAGQRVVMAHRCSYHKRKFVHLAMVDGTHLTSLVIAMRQPGENFTGSELAPALSDPGLSMYRDRVQRFQIDGFETSGHLVYLISDLPRDVNEHIFASLSRPVRDFLVKLES